MNTHLCLNSLIVFFFIWTQLKVLAKSCFLKVFIISYIILSTVMKYIISLVLLKQSSCCSLSGIVICKSILLKTQTNPSLNKS